MPIEVRHDPSGTAVAAVAALSGLTQQQNIEAEREQRAALAVAEMEQRDRQQINALTAERQMQRHEIDAAADRQREAADTAFQQTAIAAGLEKQLQADEFDREIAKKREEARIAAEQFKYEYTTQQRQEIARLNNADALVNSDPRFGEDDRREWAFIYAQKLAGITPRARPLHPGEEILPEGRGERDIWFDEKTGGYWGYDRNGKPVERKDYKDTPEGIEREREHELKLKEIEQRTTTRAARQKAAVELSKVENIRRGGLLYDKAALEQKLNEIFGEEPEQAAPEIEPPRQPVPGVEPLSAAGTLRGDQENWVQAAGEAGIEVTDADIALGPEVGQSQAFVRAITNRYGKNGRISEAAINSMPPNILARFREAIAVLKRHYATVR